MSYLESLNSYQQDLIDILLESLDVIGLKELEFTNPFVTTFIYDEDYYEEAQPFREVEDCFVTGISDDGTVFMEDSLGNIEYKPIKEFDVYDVACILDIIETGLFTEVKTD